MPGDLPPSKLMSRRSALAVMSSIGLSTGMASAEMRAQPGDMTTQAMRSVSIPSSEARILTKGFANSDDGGGAAWRRVSKRPLHPGYITDAGGAFFEIDEDVLLPEMFGAQGGNGDDFTSIQQAVTTAALSRRRLEFRGARYSVGDEILVPADADRFALIGTGATELVQLKDNKSIFLFGGENTHHWLVSGFRFLWRRDQTSASRNAYAVRFESDRSGGAGHWNFEISRCILVNGFRGFGQSDDASGKLKCPVWGGVFRRIHMGLKHSGAAIFLKTFGKSGQPNNRIEHFYARGDGLSEPAIVIESSDATVLTSLEFNRGAGCQLLLESCSNCIIQGIRFEHVALRPKDAYLIVSGKQANVQIVGLSTQSMEVVAGKEGTSAVVRASNGARVKVDGFTDMPWRARSLSREERMRNVVAIVDAQGGDITAGFVAPIFDPVLTLVRVASGSSVRFADSDNYDFVFEGKGTPVFARKLVRQRAGIVAMVFFAEGISEEVMRGLSVYSNGKPILSARKDLGPSLKFGEPVFLPDALKSDETRFILEAGSLLSISLPQFTQPAQGGAVMVSLVAIGV